jgi:hypothetical protein
VSKKSVVFPSLFNRAYWVYLSLGDVREFINVFFLFQLSFDEIKMNIIDFVQDLIICVPSSLTKIL